MNKFMNFVIDNNKLLKKIFDIFLAVILSFVGVISITSFMMFLNSSLGVSFFTCFILTIGLSQVYSAIANLFIKYLGNKVNKIDNIGYVKDNNFKSLESENIRDRFEKLSRVSKVELLNYIKEKALNDIDCDCVKMLDNRDSLSLICDFNKNNNCIDMGNGYSRKKKK